MLSEDQREIAELDLAFQHAVKHHDVTAIKTILHPEFEMVLGNGVVVTRDEVIAEAREAKIHYEIQDEYPGTQQVRVWRDTGVVTARLRIKGTQASGPFDKSLWFSDTYVRTQQGWKYAFARVSLPDYQVELFVAASNLTDVSRDG
ncbi:MAG: nuclear transport factor 2 family protein [Dechloromonas sp.]|nr:nuclear transport factor 2 family protein [Dechloromonas sp.]